MSEIQNPVRIAAAIAELAAPEVCEAWHYLDAVERLGAKKPDSPLGIQPLEIRHALERPRENTEATRAMDHWRRTGARGLLAFVGKVGRGKSHAAACWAIDRGREFKSTLWIACANWPAAKEQSDERAALVRQAQHASALVIDDLGAGSSSAPWVAEHFEGPLISRIGRFASTVILSNKSKADLIAWLGARLWDRLAYAGGVVEIPGGESMRERDDTQLDEAGRSPRWHACARLVGLIGCELEDGRLVVGRALKQEAATRGNGVNVYAAELLGLDRDAVRARAEVIDDREARLNADLAKLCKIDLPSELTFDDMTAAVTTILQRGANSDTTRKTGDESIALPQRESVAPRSLCIAPAHVAGSAVDAARLLALDHHMHVKPSPDLRTFDVVRWLGEDGHAVTLSGLPSEDQAWIAAAMSLRDELGEAVAS